MCVERIANGIFGVNLNLFPFTVHKSFNAESVLEPTAIVVPVVTFCEFDNHNSLACFIEVAEICFSTGSNTNVSVILCIVCCSFYTVCDNCNIVVAATLGACVACDDKRNIAVIKRSRTCTASCGNNGIQFANADKVSRAAGLTYKTNTFTYDIFESKYVFIEVVAVTCLGVAGGICGSGLNCLPNAVYKNLNSGNFRKPAAVVEVLTFCKFKSGNAVFFSEFKTYIYAVLSLTAIVCVILKQGVCIAYIGSVSVEHNAHILVTAACGCCNGADGCSGKCICYDNLSFLGNSLAAFAYNCVLNCIFARFCICILSECFVCNEAVAHIKSYGFYFFIAVCNDIDLNNAVTLVCYKKTCVKFVSPLFKRNCFIGSVLCKSPNAVLECSTVCKEDLGHKLIVELDNIVKSIICCGELDSIVVKTPLPLCRNVGSTVEVTEDGCST